MDWLVGGPGLSRGRRHAQDLRPGDRIDYWTVLALEPGRRLTLNFGMRAPGAGILEFEIEPLADGHANCFIETGFHKALLIDFNYETDPVTGHRRRFESRRSLDWPND